MHNPRVVIAVGVWFFVVHIGHLIAMSMLKQQCDARFAVCESATQAERDAVDAQGGYAGIVAERRMHGIVAYIVGIGFAIAYGVLAREHRGRATYYATLSFCVFGISYAVYQMIPKKLRDPTAVDQLYRASAAVALPKSTCRRLLALMAYFAGRQVDGKIDRQRVIGCRRGAIFQMRTRRQRRGRVPPTKSAAVTTMAGPSSPTYSPPLAAPRLQAAVARLQAAVARLQTAAIVRSWQTTSVARLQTANVAQIAAIRGAATCVSAAHTTDGDAAP